MNACEGWPMAEKSGEVEQLLADRTEAWIRRAPSVFEVIRERSSPIRQLLRILPTPGSEEIFVLIENAEIGVIPPDGNGTMVSLNRRDFMDRVRADLNALGIAVNAWVP